MQSPAHTNLGQDMKALTLYFAPGACSRVPLVALETIGVPFETELVAFMKGAHKSPQFKALNPSSKIPVLVANGEAISQNTAILTWLHETYPDANLLPKTNSIMERAQLLSLLVKFSADLHPLVSRIRVPQFFCDLEGGPNRVSKLAAISMREQLAPIEALLEKQTWMAGQSWSVIDAYLHWVWFRISGAGFDSTFFPKISSHYAKTLEIPAFQRALAREQSAEAHLEANGLNPKFINMKADDNAPQILA